MDALKFFYTQINRFTKFTCAIFGLCCHSFLVFWSKCSFLNAKLCQYLKKNLENCSSTFWQGSPLFVSFYIKNVVGQAFPSDRTVQEQFLWSMNACTGSIHTSVEHVHTSVEPAHTQVVKPM